MGLLATVPPAVDSREEGLSRTWKKNRQTAATSANARPGQVRAFVPTVAFHKFLMTKIGCKTIQSLKTSHENMYTATKSTALPAEVQTTSQTTVAEPLTYWTDSRHSIYILG